MIQQIHPNAGQTYDIREIIKYLKTIHKDWEITVLTARIPYFNMEDLAIDLVNIKKIDQLYSSMVFRRKLAKMLKEYDIIYIKGSYPYVFPAVQSGRPTILVVHQMDSWHLFSGFSKKLRITITNVITGSNKIGIRSIMNENILWPDVERI